MQRLDIKAYGTVRTGFIDYAINGNTLEYKGQITVKVLFSTRTVPFSGTYTNTNGFKTRQFMNPGQSNDMGMVTTKVIDVGNPERTANIQIGYTPYNLSGVVAIDTSGGPDSDVKVSGVHIQADVHGVTIHVVAAPIALLHKI